MNPLSCSIVISTLNREPYLRGLLRALERLNPGNIEVVVVVGPSTDSTDDLLAEYHGRLKVVRCPARNISVSRNLGIQAAAGDIIAFIDDDALPGNGAWIERMLAVFASEPRVGAVGGAVVVRDSMEFEFNNERFSHYGVNEACIVRDKKEFPGETWFMRVTGSNCAFRRQVLVEVGGLDEFYSYYADEVDLALRVLRHGHELRFIADNIVRHYDAKLSDKRRMVMRSYRPIGRSDVYFCLKSAEDPVMRRLFKTLSMVSRKPFVDELRLLRRLRVLSTPETWWRFASLAAGVAEGVFAGLFSERKLAPISANVSPFVQFRRVQPESSDRPLRIVLVAGAVSGRPEHGPTADVLRALAADLFDRGHEVHVVYRGQQPFIFHNHAFVEYGIDGTGAPAGEKIPGRRVLDDRVDYSVTAAAKIEELVSRGLKPDVVCAGSWDLAALAVVRRHMVPVVLLLDEGLSDAVARDEWETADELRQCIALCLWQFARASALCAFSAETAQAWRGLAGDRAGSLDAVHIVGRDDSIVAEIEGVLRSAAAGPACSVTTREP